MAPIALALQAAGHQVAFATTPDYCRHIAAHGFDCFRIGIDDVERDMMVSGPPDKPNQAASIWVNLFINARATECLADLVTICDAWHPSLIVREISEFGGCLVAERLGIPHVAVQVSGFRPHLHQLIADPLNRLRHSLGLPPDPDLRMLYRHMLLSPMPASYHQGLDLPETTLAIQNIPFDSDGQELPDWIAQLPERLTVYASLGTAYNRSADVFDAILSAVRLEPVNLILTVGEGLDPSSFGPQLPHIHIERYIPQSLLFEHCHAVITHGGFGTVTTALAFGLPMVIIPIAADQPANAQRCAKLGVARVVEPDRRTPQTIRDAVGDILTKRDFRENATRMQAEMLALPRLDIVVRQLERLANER
ncbi:MAG TPA: glycosyltransferase [Thermomicrobiales bacterium]|nr:glycosyltransferase [Thermomicrobiales bacterium]